MEPIPVTVLTGFLGSGKTTLLNRLLDHAGGRRLGVLLNDFGQIAIDARLLQSRDQDVVELANGCICCTVRDDVVPALARLLDRGPAPQAIVVETSGLADPAPLARQLLAPSLQAVVRLDAVVTVVDAANFDRALDYAESTYGQITCADLLLLNKVDLVAPSTADRVERGLQDLNPTARRVRCVRAKVPPALVLDWADGSLRAGVPEAHEPIPAATARLLPHGPHGDRFRAVSLRLAQPLDLQKLGRWLDGLPPAVFRAKGVLHLADVPCRVVLHLVGGRWTVTAGAPWAAGDDRSSELVFIARDLEEAALRRLGDDLEACQVEPP
jgi:G3E family GTPase